VLVVWAVHLWVATKRWICAACDGAWSAEVRSTGVLPRRSVVNNALRKAV
jgi:hypothetical protein